MAILCTLLTPEKNVVELHHYQGRYETRVMKLESVIELSPKQAAEWYETARMLGGVMVRPLPEIEA